MTQVLDYSSSPPGSAAIRGAGYAGAVRYCLPGHSKSLTAGEYLELIRGGCTVSLVYEGSGGQILNGRSQGGADARVALAYAQSFGAEPRCIYFACDTDAEQPAQFAAIDAYLQGAAAVIGRGRVGIYGGESVIRHVMANRTAVWFWQTAAWTSATVPGIHLFQRIGYATVNGTLCDVNDVLAPDYGQLPAPAQPKPAEDDMTPAQEAKIDLLLDRTGKLLHVWTMNGATKGTDKLPLPTAGYSAWFQLRAILRAVQDLAKHVGLGQTAAIAELDRIEAELAALTPAPEPGPGP